MKLGFLSFALCVHLKAIVKEWKGKAAVVIDVRVPKVEIQQIKNIFMNGSRSDSPTCRVCFYPKQTEENDPWFTKLEVLVDLQKHFMFLHTHTAECVHDWTFINSSQIKSQTAAARQIIGWESSGVIDGGRFLRNSRTRLHHNTIKMCFRCFRKS